MIGENRILQFSGGSMTALGITIHNTNNQYSAEENYQLMLNSSMSYSAHFFVDKDIAIQALPLNVRAFHTGKAYDNGNKYTIAIEICSRGNDEEFNKAVENTVLLIQMIRNELGNLPIYFHNDFDRTKYCPHRILDQYQNKENFIRRWNLVN